MQYFALWLLAVLSAPAAIPTPIAPAPQVQVMTDTSIHAAFDSLLQQYVSDKGTVNYKGLKKDKARLEAYLQTLSDHIPQDNDSRAAQMAYWINAYNAFTLHLIIQHYPISSITKLDNGQTWEVKRIVLANKKYSLNKIENEILRPKYKDPRIHFAVNCAAKSCPPLYNHAYTADNLEEVLEARTKAFINNSQYNTLGASSVKVSKIFEWYAADFGVLISFLNKYSKTKINKKATVVYQEYNWDLND